MLEIFDPILTVLLFVALSYRVFAASFTDDDIKGIKHLCWAVLFAVVLIGELVSKV